MRKLATTLFAGVFVGALTLPGSGCQGPCKQQAPTVTPAPSSPRLGEKAKVPVAPKDPRTAALRRKISRFAIAPLSTNEDRLTAQERAVLGLLIDASRDLDPIYDRQVWARNPELAQALSEQDSDWRRTQAEYAAIMRGPWDRQDEHRPFAIDRAKPPGSGFYPEDVTREDFENYVRANPERRAALEQLLTVITREERGWVARPYHRVYRSWLEPCANKLDKASRLTRNPSLAKFLRSRARALLTDDYYASEVDWMDLDSPVEITIGPYETYEDQLLGLKAAYESYVTVTDPRASARLDRFKSQLMAMEQNLPIEAQYKAKRGPESPIRVADLVFSSGQARGSVQAIAYNLPNDEKVQAQKGAKKVLLSNLIRAKFDYIAKPIGERVLAKEQRDALSGTAFFHEVLFHELAHSLGPAKALTPDGAKDVRMALGPFHSSIEEAKADVMGVYNLLFMIKQRMFQKRFTRPVLLTYFAGLFRSARFGATEAHGQAAALQLNYFFKKGVAAWDENQKAYRVREDLLERAVGQLLSELLMLQAKGQKAKAQTMLETLGVMTPGIERATSRLDDIPVDIRPYYPLAGEKGPPMALGWNEGKRRSSR